MNLSYTKKGIKHEPLKSWEMGNGGYIAIYQGSRGGNPELDYIVKYRTPNSRLRAPSHTHWIVDLLLKYEHAPNQVTNFITEWLDLSERLEPFSCVEERNNYEFMFTEYFSDRYQDLDNLGAFSIEFVSGMIELFIRCEKQTPGAFMFKNLLELVRDYCTQKKDFYQIVSYSKRV